MICRPAVQDNRRILTMVDGKLQVIGGGVLCEYCHREVTIDCGGNQECNCQRSEGGFDSDH